MQNTRTQAPSGFWQRFQRMEEGKFGLILTLPTMLLVLVFLVLPILYAIYMSVNRIELTISSEWKFNGLDNYLGLLNDPRLLATLPRTLYFAALNVVVTTLMALGLALVLNEKFVGRNWIRVFILLPWAVAPVVSGVMWRYMFHQRYGLINAILKELGLIDQYIVWFDNPVLALSIASFATSWKALPFSTLILLASMQSISESLFRAAKMDGANIFHRFRYVVLPHLRPTLIFVVVLQIITSLQAFDVIFSLTRGGPGEGTVVLNYLTFINAFERLSIGNAAAMAILLALLIMSLSALSIYISSRRT